MRSLKVSALVLAGVLAGAIAAPGAFAAQGAPAAQTSQGTVASVDVKANSFKLSDGVTYVAPKGYRLSALKPGEKVKVAWVMQNAKHDATQITMIR